MGVNRKKNLKVIVLDAAIVCCIAVLGVTGTFIYKHYHQLNESNDKIRALQKSADTPDNTENDQFTPTKEFYKQMKERYPDYIGWLAWDTGIVSEPVVQGRSNQEYLRKDIDGEYDIYGTVFMDALDTLDDSNLMLYGHSIPGDYHSVVKFNQLQNMLSKDFAEQHKCFRFYLEDRVDVYEVFSAFQYGSDICDSYDYSQNTFVDTDAFQEWINQSLNHSLIGYRDSETTTVDDHYMTLQTCADDDGVAKDIVIAIRVRSEEY